MPFFFFFLFFFLPIVLSSNSLHINQFFYAQNYACKLNEIMIIIVK